MMNAPEILLICLALFVIFFIVPPFVYMVIKFGASGYFRAKERNKSKHRNKNNTL